MEGTPRRILKTIGTTVVAVICIFLLAPYVRYTAYEAEGCQPFAGEKWYNPYANVKDTVLRANFHAHSRSWAGLTWGENTSGEIIEAYSARGYDIPALSNYHKITPEESFPEPLIYIPTYEHGMNIQKVHCLCIGAKEVRFVDYPWHFSLSHTQNIMHSLRQHCDLVAMAHPGARLAHTPKDMAWLDGMQVMELANKKEMDVPYWDGALSCGRACWVLSNDDIHSLLDEKIFRHWNMIYVPEPNASSVIQAMKSGHHYGVVSYDGMCEDNRLTSFQISGDTLFVALRESFNRLDFIGQGGTSLHTVSHSAGGWYVLRDSDAYVRVEVHHDHCVMYLNPILRYSGDILPFEKTYNPVVQVSKTWATRGVFSLLIGVVILIWLWRVKRR